MIYVNGVCIIHRIYSGSGCLLKDLNNKNKIVIAGSKHVACPWLFPNYYREKWDWLQHVNETHVQHFIQTYDV